MTRGAPYELSQARRWGARMLSLALLSAPARATAGAPNSVEFSAPLSGCPEQTVLKERVAQLAGGANATPSPARVLITRTASGYRTEVTLMQGQTRQRSFDTRDLRRGRRSRSFGDGAGRAAEFHVCLGGCAAQRTPPTKTEPGR